jgi:hypothetical protein
LLVLYIYVNDTSMLTTPTKLLAVRLPEADKRRFKSLAASQGISLQEAVHQALEAWASQAQPEAAPPGPRAGTKVQKPRRRDRPAKLS